MEAVNDENKGGHNDCDCDGQSKGEGGVGEVVLNVDGGSGGGGGAELQTIVQCVALLERWYASPRDDKGRMRGIDGVCFDDLADYGEEYQPLVMKDRRSYRAGEAFRCFAEHSWVKRSRILCGVCWALFGLSWLALWMPNLLIMLIAYVWPWGLRAPAVNREEWLRIMVTCSRLLRRALREFVAVRVQGREDCYPKPAGLTEAAQRMCLLKEKIEAMNKPTGLEEELQWLLQPSGKMGDDPMILVEWKKLHRHRLALGWWASASAWWVFHRYASSPEQVDVRALGTDLEKAYTAAHEEYRAERRRKREERRQQREAAQRW